MLCFCWYQYLFVWKLLMLVGFEHVLVDVVAAALQLALVGLEADL